MILFTIFWCNTLKTDPSKEICTYATLIKSFFPDAYPNKLLYVCYCSTFKILILLRILLENKEYCFLIIHFPFPRLTSILNSMLQTVLTKNCTIFKALSSALNDRVASNLFY